MIKDFIIENTGDYDEWLIERLKEPEEARAYWEAAFEAYKEDNDGYALYCAAMNVCQAHYPALNPMIPIGICVNIFEQCQNSIPNPTPPDFLQNVPSVDLARGSDDRGLSKRGKPIIQNVDRIQSGDLVDIGVIYA